MSRMVVNRAESDDGPDVMRWADRMLIRLVKIIESFDFAIIPRVLKCILTPVVSKIRRIREG